VNRDERPRSGRRVTHGETLDAELFHRENDAVAERMVFLGFGKWVRADKIYALEPITGPERGGGRRTRVWVEGVPEPLLASRTERTILADMGQDVPGVEKSRKPSQDEQLF
jgi:hypothetical protein